MKNEQHPRDIHPQQIPRTKDFESKESIPAKKFHLERKDHKMRLMQQSHEQALAALQLETIISQLDFVDPSEDKINECLQVLQEDVRVKFIKIIKKYGEQLRTTKRRMRILIRDLEQTGEDNDSVTEITPQYMGEKVFYNLTHRHPDGIVTFEQREAYCVMLFENPEDYDSIDFDKDLDAKIQEVVGLSSGWYHRAIELPLIEDKAFVPVLFVREPVDQEEIDLILTHERQHFINDRLFGAFNNTERVGESASSVEKRYRDIKDEALAYIREGEDGSGIAKSLRSNLYADLFKDLSKEEGVEVGDIINKIKECLDKNRWYLKSKKTTALLVYQLAAIPFDRIPNWLEAIFAYYRQCDEFWELFPDLFDKFYGKDFSLENLKYDIFPSDPESDQAIVNISGLLNKLYNLQEEIDSIITDLGLTKEQRIQRLRVYISPYALLCKQLLSESEKLKQDAGVMPHASLADLYKYDESDDGHFEETAFVRKVRQAVVDAVQDFPQAQVDSWAYYLNSKDRIKPSRPRKLDKIIKDTVKAQNGGKRCSVRFDSNPIYDNSFRVVINFTVNEEDREYGFEEVEFQLHFHSSKFVPFETPRFDGTLDKDGGY